jgi:hypothetical protein
MLRHSAQRSGLALTQVSPRELRHQPMQTTHIVYKFQQMHKKVIYYNYVAVNRVVADLTKPMDETGDSAACGQVGQRLAVRPHHQRFGQAQTDPGFEVGVTWLNVTSWPTGI